MAAFRIRTERLPVRCEICHQADLFDGVSGRCGRCEGVSLPKFTPPPVRMGRIPWWERILWLNGLRGVLALFLLGLLLSFLCAFLFPLLEDVVAFAPESRPRSLLEVLEPQGGAPRMTIGPDQKVEVKGLLSDAKPDLILQSESFSGIVIQEPVRKCVGAFEGFKFRIQVGADDPDCFLPRIDQLSQDEQNRIEKLLSEKSTVSIEGCWDSTAQMIFVDRIVFQPEKKTPPAKTPPAKTKSHSKAKVKF